jgi:hypothetical protein
MASTRKAHKPAAEQLLVAEEQAFRRQRAKLLRRYEGQYVAFHQGRVVGHGPDDEELARQLFADLGDQPFYIARVEREPTVHELPSPELER